VELVLDAMNIGVEGNLTYVDELFAMCPLPIRDLTFSTGQNYTQDIIDASLGKPVAHVENASPKKDSPFVTRIIQWSQTRTYLRFMQDYGFKKPKITKIDLDSQVRQLRTFSLNGTPSAADEEKAVAAVKELVEVVESDEDLMEVFSALSKQSVDLDDIMKRFKRPMNAKVLFHKHERNIRRLSTITQGLLTKSTSSTIKR